MKEKELRETIEWAKNFKENFKDGVGKVEELTYADKNLTIIIQTLKTLNEASGELGEKKPQCYCICEYDCGCGHERYNQMHDKASIVVAKYKLRVKELEEEIKSVREYLWASHGHPFAGKYGDDGEMQCQLCKPFDYKRSPLLDIIKGVIKSKLQEKDKRIEELEKQIKTMHDNGLGESWVDRVDELKQKLQATEKELADIKEMASEGKIEKIIKSNFEFKMEYLPQYEGGVNYKPIFNFGKVSSILSKQIRGEE